MFSATLTLVALVLFWYVLVLFFVALKRRDNSIVDSAWGPGFLLAVLATVLWQRPSGSLVSLVVVLVAVWAIRLSAHILARNWNRGEDWRYAQWRQQWGSFFVVRSFLQVFVLQGFLMIVVALPALWVVTFGGTITSGALIGAGVWLLGFLWEVIGDGQLTQFLNNPSNKGRVMKSGLWKYSRHPNYFGEMTQWWGMWLIALTIPGGWMTILGPLTITFLITKVSGVPLLENKQMQNPEFQEYARHTPTVIPWFPKK